MLRTLGHKYIVFSRGARPEMLFDMRADPGEMHNLARVPAQAEELARHRALLREWIERTDDHFRFPPDLVSP